MSSIARKNDSLKGLSYWEKSKDQPKYPKFNGYFFYYTAHQVASLRDFQQAMSYYQGRSLIICKTDFILLLNNDRVTITII